jgi:hypothetical protein
MKSKIADAAEERGGVRARRALRAPPGCTGCTQATARVPPDPTARRASPLSRQHCGAGRPHAPCDALQPASAGGAPAPRVAARL